MGLHFPEDNLSLRSERLSPRDSHLQVEPARASGESLLE